MKTELPKVLVTEYKDYVYRLNHYSDRINADLGNDNLYFTRGKFLLNFFDKLEKNNNISSEIRLLIFEQAITDFSKTVELNFKFIGAYYYRGLCFYNSVFYHDNESQRWRLYLAIEDFSKIIELGDLKIRKFTGDIEQSQFDLIIEAYLLRGKCYQIQGHLYLYFKDLESLISIDPTMNSEELQYAKEMYDRLKSNKIIQLAERIKES